MGRSDAERALHEIKRILRDLKDYDKLDESKRGELVRRAAREEPEIDEIMRLLKRLDQGLRRSKEELAG
jgi:hypothetical protein